MFHESDFSCMYKVTLFSGWISFTFCSRLFPLCIFHARHAPMSTYVALPTQPFITSFTVAWWLFFSSFTMHFKFITCRWQCRHTFCAIIDFTQHGFRFRPVTRTTTFIITFYLTELIPPSLSPHYWINTDLIAFSRYLTVIFFKKLPLTDSTKPECMFNTWFDKPCFDL